MMEALGAPEIILFILVSLIGAGFAGFAAGLLGIGGGFIMVPVLYYLFGAIGADSSVALHCAVGTSLCTIITTGVVSAWSHYRRNAVDMPWLFHWAPALAVGTAAGAIAASYIDTGFLAIIFASFALAVSINMSFGKSVGHPDPKAPSAPPPAGLPYAVFIPGGIGLVSALIGIGGGALSVPAFTYSGVAIHRAVATSASIGPVIGFVGALGFIITGWGIEGRPPFSLGYVNVPAFVLFSLPAALAAPLGAKTAHALPQLALKRIFALFCSVAACRLVYDAITG